MAEPSYSAVMANNPIVVIGSQYCNPCPVDLAIARKVKTVKDGKFVVSDVNGNLMFKVKGKAFTFFHRERLILDAQGNPLVTLKEKALTQHSRWNVFRGESTEDKDFLYTIKKTSILQHIYKTKYAVFLANNTSKEKVYDFMVKGNWYERSCVIYAGDSSTIIAQMGKKIMAQSLLIGKDNFMVTVYPNVDYAFIVSLIVIFDSFNAANDASFIGGNFGEAAGAISF